MPSRFLDWLGRVVMLVLAGMVTLSIIGSIASIPSGSFETRVGLQAPPPVPEQSSPEPPPLDPVQGQPGPASEAPAGTQQGRVTVAAPVPPEPAGPERWLEAITYALLALVGLAALNALLLWRSLGTRRRIADALEELAARR